MYVQRNFLDPLLLKLLQLVLEKHPNMVLYSIENCSFLLVHISFGALLHPKLSGESFWRCKHYKDQNGTFGIPTFCTTHHALRVGSSTLHFSLSHHVLQTLSIHQHGDFAYLPIYEFETNKSDTYYQPLMYWNDESHPSKCIMDHYLISPTWSNYSTVTLLAKSWTLQYKGT